MSGTIKIKRRSSTGAAGAPATLKNAELAYNENDNTEYYGYGDDGAGNATSIIPIGGKGAFVDLPSAQTIAGIKTFSSAPLVPTQTVGDNTTKAASTAFVQAAVGAAGGAQSPNTVYSGPASGGSSASPTFRTLVPADIPSIPSTKISDKGSVNGVASLDGSGKIPTSQLPSTVLGSLNYKGTYDASTAVYPSSPSKGDYYVISVAGTISGTAYAVGDWATYDGTTWDKIDNSTKVSSVFGRQGAVVATSGDYNSDQVTEGTTNLYFLGSRVLAVLLAGLSVATNSAITASDSILSALGKLQAQVTARLIASNNLSDLPSTATARTNLGLGSMATQSATAVAITGGTIDGVTFDGGTF